MLAALIALAAAGAIVAVACGGGGGGKQEDVSLIPTLAGTAIPTVSPIPPTQAVCTPPAQLALPASIPSDVPIPPDYVVWSVSTSPYLHVEGRVAPPARRDEPGKGIVAAAITGRMLEMKWRFTLNAGADGQDYNFSTPDTPPREGHFLAATVPGCPGQVQLNWDFKWITG